jgi:hypothetical protein
MAAVTSYEVVVSREGNDWLAEVPALRGARTYARSLPSLKEYIREAVVLMADLPDDARPELTYRFTFTDKRLAEAVRLREERTRVDELERQVKVRTAALADQLQRAGFSVRDVGELLGVSGGRISQLRTASRKAGIKRDRATATVARKRPRKARH